VCLVEGPADLLALKQLGVPALALCGTHPAGATLELLGRWARLYVVFDEDLAGQEATARLIRSFHERVIPVQLPAGVTDPADLAARQDGAELFRMAIRQAAQRWRCQASAGLDDRT
jgi:DNA primase